MERNLEFRLWLVSEGFLDAASAGWRTFCQEISRPKTVAFEGQISNIATATDVLFAVDNFYKVVAPTVDAKTAKRLERRLEAAIQRAGYKIPPKAIEDMRPTVPKA